MADDKRKPEELSEEELEGERGEQLPDREAMTLLGGAREVYAEGMPEVNADDEFGPGPQPTM